MAEPLTVCVLTYNRPALLRETLTSIVAQTTRRFRLVVLDNASTTDYSATLKHFARAHVEYVRHPHPTDNLIVALRDYADREFLVVFHDDDLMHPDLLRRQLAVMESDPGMRFVAT